jgi:hypothetical protein
MLLAGVAGTGFQREEIERVLKRPSSIDDWRVGEAIAEAFLLDHRACLFPWPDGRDERKRGSCLPGADLVGFQLDGEENRFAFGEVKTSGDANYPPNAMYGRTGLKQQLEDLRDDATVRDDLVKYLGYRAPTAVWRARYEEASSRYLADNRDVRLFGLLIRDVPPNDADLRARVDSLSAGCASQTGIELLAIYLPAGSTGELAAKAAGARSGGAA